MGGTDIAAACTHANITAKEQKCPIEFDFNSITVSITEESNPLEVAAEYLAECDRRRAAYEASPEYKQRQEQAAAAKAAKDAELTAALDACPANMTLADAEGWKKAVAANPDPYGAAVMTYAERWARLMEGKILCGEKLSEIAEKCSILADVEGITGFMYGAAVATLAKVWIHGEALRQWHNKDTQIGTEGDKANASGGVLNPALLSIG